MLREIRDRGSAGGDTVLKDFLRTIRPTADTPFECRFETPPGRQAQVDFACFRTAFTDEPEAERIVWLLSLVPGHRRLLWGRFVARQDLQTVLRCHIATFESLGGVPAEILYDRMKTAVRGETADQGIADNPTLLDLAAHDGFLPKACKLYRPQTKGKVERPFHYIRENFFLGRSFRTLDDLNVQFRQWLEGVATSRRHGTTGRIISEHFAAERRTSSRCRPARSTPCCGWSAGSPGTAWCRSAALSTRSRTAPGAGWSRCRPWPTLRIPVIVIGHSGRR